MRWHLVLTVVVAALVFGFLSGTVRALRARRRGESGWLTWGKAPPPPLAESLTPVPGRLQTVSSPEMQAQLLRDAFFLFHRCASAPDVETAHKWARIGSAMLKGFGPAPLPKEKP